MWHKASNTLSLSLVPKYSNKYVPKTTLQDFPMPFQSLYHSKYIKMKYNELLNVCESLKVDFTKDQAIAVEKETKSQAKSKLWFKYCTGRITSSRMKAICHTNASNPSQSLIKSICYPEAFCFISKQTSWGCKHENEARDCYVKKVAQQHADFRLQDSGLVINNEWPHIGECTRWQHSQLQTLWKRCIKNQMPILSSR